MADEFFDIADFQIAVDLCKSYADRAHELTVLQSVDAADALDKLIAAARFAREMVANRAVSVLEQPIMTGGNVWYVSDDYADRDDHDAIAAAVAAAAVYAHGKQGGVDSVPVAMATARMMRELYVSPSTTVKKGAADQIGLTDYRHRENRGKKLVKKQVEEPQT